MQLISYIVIGNILTHGIVKVLVRALLNSLLVKVPLSLSLILMLVRKSKVFVCLRIIVLTHPHHFLHIAKSDQVAADINAAGGRAISVPGNVMDPAFPEKVVEETVKAFGKINHIVNNAGYTHDGMLHKINDKQWESMLTVHQTAPFKIIRAAAKYLVSDIRHICIFTILF